MGNHEIKRLKNIEATLQKSIFCYSGLQLFNFLKKVSGFTPTLNQ
ncbi:hypothetical protein CWATWH0401_90 [Crocosphaera watsonii WH 0401]|uniref:Uncharacterized protein n=3 Tax=Crocosphaera watsonii TaxID=263511 RepID=G5J062_CROWT|nr:hypothetical protein CWATWH0003_0899 [Crocosphaera watsonii WH 0003]CCQ54544.1 hypothetical protein CWATWH0005_2590 [Crocosphaera watsonii WH 0005]CCQ63431.1 hypothetical protein CWATWH0401_90 [Crocosphaera watsonii WH 0401]